MTKRTKDIFQKKLAEYGEEILIKEYENGHPSISTGSLALDVSTGIGGIPAGRYTELYGPESGGKTTLSLNIVKEAIKLSIPTLYVDVENSLDFAYVEDVLEEFYNPNLVTIIQPRTAEDAFELTDNALSSDFGCIIFDSIAAISPEDELDEDSYGKLKVGLSARLTNQFLRKTAFKIRDNETVFIFTNQVRANIGSYVGGFTTPAGLALKHYSSLRVYLSKGQAIKEDNDQIGNFVNFIVKKNKVGVPFRQAQTNLIYGKGINYCMDVVKFSSMLGVLKSRGAYFAFEGETLGQGVANTVETLENNNELLDKIVESCYNTVGVRYPPIRPNKGMIKDEG